MRHLRLSAALTVVALALVAGGSAAPPATLVAETMTVGVNLPSEGFQVGIVRGSEVVYAQGFEIDFARELARRLELPITVFVQSRFDRLFSAGSKPWDLAIAEISITPERRRTTTFSKPYLVVDQGVLVAQSLPSVPQTIAELRGLRICALRKSTGAVAAQQRIAPTKPVKLIPNVPLLMLGVQTGKCDAVVYDFPALATLKSRAPQRFGAFAGVLETGEQYGIALPRESTLVGLVNRAITAMERDGTTQRLEKRWLTIDPTSMRVLK